MRIITNLAIIFVIIFSPFFFIMDIHTRDQIYTDQLKDQYTTALRTAAQDAGMVLNINESQEFESGYESDKFTRVDKDLALDTFFKTLYLNFTSNNDHIGQAALISYVPAIAVLDYDGFFIYANDEYKDTEGMPVYKHSWRAKKPYAFADDAGNVINFTLDNYVIAYEVSTQRWIQGFQRDLIGQTTIPLLDDPVNFEAKRRSTIVKSVQDDVAYYINKHNEYATRIGVSYTFKLPTIPEEDWVNTLNDVGLIAFIQGIPIGDQYYNNYAFGGGRLIKKKEVLGGIDPQTGYRYYYRSDCNFPYQIEEVFESEKEAASKGYYPKECINNQS
ncbi:hypothetical protein [Bacillus sp. FSL K6-6540]|uniref:hypothetical protein n=1 Tax=Bacillus sp. FSL K6-6540 TaxID=2921512 RepID=UPI0030F4D926